MRRLGTRLPVVVTAVVAAVALVTGCSEDPPTTATGDVAVIEVTFAGGDVTPSGERVSVGLGQPIDLVVKADEPGEIHVHDEAEQQLAYGVGTTTLKLVLEQPGVVEVESHDLEKVIVQLEVS